VLVIGQAEIAELVEDEAESPEVGVGGELAEGAGGGVDLKRLGRDPVKGTGRSGTFAPPDTCATGPRSHRLGFGATALERSSALPKSLKRAVGLWFGFIRSARAKSKACDGQQGVGLGPLQQDVLGLEIEVEDCARGNELRGRGQRQRGGGTVVRVHIGETLAHVAEELDDLVEPEEVDSTTGHAVASLAERPDPRLARVLGQGRGAGAALYEGVEGAAVAKVLCGDPVPLYCLRSESDRAHHKKEERGDTRCGLADGVVLEPGVVVGDDVGMSQLLEVLDLFEGGEEGGGGGADGDLLEGVVAELVAVKDVAAQVDVAALSSSLCGLLKTSYPRADGPTHELCLDLEEALEEAIYEVGVEGRGAINWRSRSRGIGCIGVRVAEEAKVRCCRGRKVRG
jgi:hypothetical protein